MPAACRLADTGVTCRYDGTPLGMPMASDAAVQDRGCDDAGAWNAEWMRCLRALTKTQGLRTCMLRIRETPILSSRQHLERPCCLQRWKLIVPDWFQVNPRHSFLLQNPPAHVCECAAPVGWQAPALRAAMRARRWGCRRPATQHSLTEGVMMRVPGRQNK